MVHKTDKESRCPAVSRTVQTEKTGIRHSNIETHVVGYVINGRKNIYVGDTCKEVNPGEMFYIIPGKYHIENIPDANKRFEEIVVGYSISDLSEAIMSLNLKMDMEVHNISSCNKCSDPENVVFSVPPPIDTFFKGLEYYLNDGIFNSDPQIHYFKMQEMTYLLMIYGECCLKSKLLRNIDPNKETFDQIIQRNIFKEVTIESLARQTNKSLTSFKHEFRKYYNESPHKWLTQQRLKYSRILLISSSKSISEIGNECVFPNTSHFIKLFKKRYQVTPASYRQQHLAASDEIRAKPVRKPRKKAEKISQ